MRRSLGRCLQPGEDIGQGVTGQGGQGNRVKELCGDEACEEVVIPGGDFAAESEGILSPGSPD